MNKYIFIDQDINTLKQEMKSTKSELLERLLEQCDRYFGVELPEEHPKLSTTYMGIAAANLSLAYTLTDNGQLLDEAKRWIFTCVNYPHWGNAHLVDVDLSAAWILFGLGLSYDWLKDTLTEEEREQLRYKIILQANRMYDFKIKTEGSGWSTNYWQNHNWINLTGLATAGYAIVDEYPEANNWITCAKENFDFVYSVLPEDGSDYEGVVYWRYGAMWLFLYAHLLKEREGINYFQTCDFLKNTFYYRLYQAAPNLEEQINFGDCHDRRSGHTTAIYYKVASEYKNGHAQKLGNLVRKDFLHREQEMSGVKPGIYPESLFEVLFYDAKVEEKSFDDLPLVKYFDDLGLLVIRSSWEKDAVHFSFKCSYPGGKKQWENLWKLKEEKNYNCFGLSHQHPDNNSFVLNAYGHYMTIDDGYNRTVKASDHNVVIVDGQGYMDENQNNIWKNYTKDMVAEVEKFIVKPGVTYIVGETAKTYKPELKLNRFARHVLNTGNPYFIIMDELESDIKHTYTSILYTDFYPEVEENRFIYDYKDATCEVINVSPLDTQYEFVDNNVRAVMTTQEPDKFRETQMKGLRISNDKPEKIVNFMNVIIPRKKDGIEYKVTKVDNDTAFGVRVEGEELSDIVLYSKGNGITYEDVHYNLDAVLIKQTKDKKKEMIEL